MYLAHRGLGSVRVHSFERLLRLIEADLQTLNSSHLEWASTEDLGVDRKGICPVCGEVVGIAGRTKDGRLIGGCGDAFDKDAWMEEVDVSLKRVLWVQIKKGKVSKSIKKYETTWEEMMKQLELTWAASGCKELEGSKKLERRKRHLTRICEALRAEILGEDLVALKSENRLEIRGIDSNGQPRILGYVSLAWARCQPKLVEPVIERIKFQWASR